MFDGYGEGEAQQGEKDEDDKEFVHVVRVVESLVPMNGSSYRGEFCHFIIIVVAQPTPGLTIQEVGPPVLLKLAPSFHCAVFRR